MYKEPNMKWVKILQEKYLNNNNLTKLLKVDNPHKGSRFCNFLLSCRPVIIEYLSWDVYEGESTLF